MCHLSCRTTATGWRREFPGELLACWVADDIDAFLNQDTSGAPALCRERYRPDCKDPAARNGAQSLMYLSRSIIFIRVDEHLSGTCLICSDCAFQASLSSSNSARAVGSRIMNECHSALVNISLDTTSASCTPSSGCSSTATILSKMTCAQCRCRQKPPCCWLEMRLPVLPSQPMSCARCGSALSSTYRGALQYFNFGCMYMSCLFRQSGSRVVEHEHILIDALRAAVGPEHIEVFTGGTMDRAGMERQIFTFRKAQIIIGWM